MIDEAEEEGCGLEMPDVPYRRVAFVEPAIKHKAQRQIRQIRRLSFAWVRPFDFVSAVGRLIIVSCIYLAYF